MMIHFRRSIVFYGVVFGSVMNATFANIPSAWVSARGLIISDEKKACISFGSFLLVSEIPSTEACFRIGPDKALSLHSLLKQPETANDASSY